MSAVVCGKRSNSIFDELPHASPPISKRIRCSAGTSSPRFSPPRASFDLCNSTAYNGGDSSSSPLARLRSLFPDMDPQLLERALEAAGNDLDSAIKSLNDLHLEPAEMNVGFSVNKSENGIEATFQLQTEAILNTNGGDVPSETQSATNILPKDGSEWVDLFVREMMNASDVDDARSRASRVLEVLEKSIVTHAGAEATQSFQKENIMLKEQVQVLLRENSVLKRAVAIQHERQKEYDERSQEMQHLKQLVSQYQEQLRTLEVNNYALTMHLRQAQQSNSIPGRFHPDVF